MLMICILSLNVFVVLSAKSFPTIQMETENPFVTMGEKEDIRLAKVGKNQFKIFSQKIDFISDAVKINGKVVNVPNNERRLAEMDSSNFDRFFTSQPYSSTANFANKGDGTDVWYSTYRSSLLVRFSTSKYHPCNTTPILTNKTLLSTE